MPSMGFDSEDLSSLIADYPMDHNLSLTRTTESRQGDRDEGDRRFKYKDFSSADATSTDTGVPSWPTTQAGVSESSLESGRDREAEARVPSAKGVSRGPAKGHMDLLKLSMELMEDQERMNTQAPFPPRPPIAPNPLKCSSSIQQQPINHMLDQASRLWDIIKDLSTAGDTPRLHTGSGYENGANTQASGNAGNGARQASMRPRSAVAGHLASNGDLDPSPFPATSESSYKSVDPILIANLVTTYVCLLRSCRSVFARLYHALLMAPASEENSLISLPGLQFGNFPLENNLAIQVRVLIELALGMLHRISNSLGINPADVIGGSSSPTPNDDAAYRMPFLGDPVAISIRQIILSQEMMQSNTQNGDPPPLAMIIKNIQALLERRYLPPFLSIIVSLSLF